MAFTRANPLGWALFEELTSAQMNIIDLNHSRAIDGTGGGTYNPANPIVINGTLEVSDLDIDTIVADDFTTNNLTVTGLATFSGGFGVNFIGPGPVNIATALNVTGIAGFSNDVNFLLGTVTFSNLAPLVVGGTANFNNGVDFNAQTNFNSQTNYTSGSTTSFDNGAETDVQASHDWDFHNRPKFNDGLELGVADYLHFDGLKTYTWRFAPYPVQFNETYFSISNATQLRQFNNSLYPIRTHFNVPIIAAPPAGVNRTITLFRVYTDSVNLDGSPDANPGDTSFTLRVSDFYGNLTATMVADDPDPNVNGNRSFSAVNATNFDDDDHLQLYFLGYNGGDTLNGTDNYIVSSFRIDMTADRAIGV